MNISPRQLFQLSPAIVSHFTDHGYSPHHLCSAIGSVRVQRGSVCIVSFSGYRRSLIITHVTFSDTDLDIDLGLGYIIYLYQHITTVSVQLYINITLGQTV